MPGKVIVATCLDGALTVRTTQHDPASLANFTDASKVRDANAAGHGQRVVFPAVKREFERAFAERGGDRDEFSVPQ